MDEIPASDFDGQGFDACEFVQRYRKRVPLSQLQKGLRAHQAATKQELVDLINEKYADFVSLSSRMQGVERALRPLRAPLEESSELTKHLHSRLGALLGEADDAHGKLAGIRARKEALSTYIDNAKLLDKAKATADKQWGNPQESDDFLREHVAHESVSRDLRRIRLNLGANTGSETKEGSETETSPECQALLAEAAAFEASFAERLRERLHGMAAAAKRAWDVSPQCPESADEEGSATLKASEVNIPRMELLAIAHLCRALATLGRCDVVEDVFADVFVKGVLEAAVASCMTPAAEEQQKGTSLEAASPVSGSAHASAPLSVNADLGPFFKSVESALLTEGAPLLWLARCLRGGSASGNDSESVLLAVPSLHLISNVGVAHVLKHVQKVWPTVFMPASPDVFAANYSHAANFIRAAKALMSPAEHRALLESAALTDFQRRWKTHVYSEMRKKEAVKHLEAAAKVADAHGSDLLARLVQLIKTIWSDKWYLDILYPKMMQLSLDLLARYGKIVKRIADSPDVPGAWDAAAAQPTWASTSNPVRLPRAAANIFQLLSGIATEDVGEIARLVLDRAPGGPDGRPAELARALLREADSALRPTLGDLEVAMLRQVAAATTPQFSSIPGIPRVFRLLNKPVPTKASPYVEPSLRPIQAFREVASEAAPAEAVVGWMQRAVDAAAGEFSTQAAQLLESLRQQEASFRRLPLGKTNSGDKDAGLTDLDKIHIQLCLDVDTFTAAAAELGVVPESAPNLSKLAETVARIRAPIEQYLSR